MTRKIGIMQGRLSPPVGKAIQAFPLSTWRNEFAAAQEVGLNHIEWIFDTEDSLNPIASDPGLAEIKDLSAQTGVKVNSLCADYFMSELLLGETPAQEETRAEKLRWLLAQCAKAGIRYIVLPFVDRSAIKTDADKGRLVALMLSLLPDLAHHGMEFHLETSLEIAHQWDTTWMKNLPHMAITSGVSTLKTGFAGVARFHWDAARSNFQN